MTRKGRMDVAEANYFSAPYCPITSTSGQRDLRAEVCSPFVIHHAVMMKRLPSIGWPIFGAEPVICKQKCNFNEGFSGYCFPGKLGFYFNELIFQEYSGRACWALTTSVVGYKRSSQCVMCTLLFQFPSLSPWIEIGVRAGVPSIFTSYVSFCV